MRTLYLFGVESNANRLFSSSMYKYTGEVLHRYKKSLKDVFIQYEDIYKKNRHAAYI